MSIDYTPEDFAGRSAGHVTAETKFDRFVEACQFATRAAYVHDSHSLVAPMIVAANDQSVWPLPCPGGSLGTTIPWLKGEMQELGANWFFFALPTDVAVTYDDNGFADTGDQARLERQANEMVPGIFWYAAAKNGSWFVRRSGIVRFLDDDLSPFWDGPTEQGAGIFDSVLA